MKPSSEQTKLHGSCLKQSQLNDSHCGSTIVPLHHAILWSLYITLPMQKVHKNRISQTTQKSTVGIGQHSSVVKRVSVERVVSGGRGFAITLFLHTPESYRASAYIYLYFWYGISLSSAGMWSPWEVWGSHSSPVPSTSAVSNQGENQRSWEAAWGCTAVQMDADHVQRQEAI